MSSREPEPTTETHRTLGGNLGVSRRGFMRATTAGTAAAVGGGTLGATWGITQPASGQTAPTADAQITAVNALYDGLKDLFSSGYDADEADDREATNLHWDTFDAAAASQDYMEGFFTELLNMVSPLSDPDQSNVANLVWAEIRASVFESIQNGNTATEAKSSARDVKDEYLAVRQVNLIRQFNALIVDIVSWMAPFIPDEHLGEWDEPEDWGSIGRESDVSLGTIEDTSNSNNRVATQNHSSGLGPSEPFKFDNIVDGGNQEVRFSPEEINLVDGSTAPSYRFEVYGHNGNGWDYADSQWITVNDNGGSDGSGINVFSLEVHAPDDTEPVGKILKNEAMSGDAQFHEIWQALISINDTIESEIGTYIDDIYAAVSAGDIEAMDIMGPTEWVVSNDSGTAERLTAEYMGLGLLPPADGGGTLVEVSSPALSETREGHFFVDWDFTRLNSWEYSYDPTAGDESIEIDADSFRPDATYTFTFSSTGDVEVNAGDFTEGDGAYSYSFTDAGLGESESLDSIAVDASGKLKAFAPVGETLTIGEQASHAVIAFEGAEGSLIRETFTDGDELTIQAVGGDDSDGTRLRFEGYNQQTRDPARAVEQVQYTEQQRTYVSEMDEDAPIFGGGGSGNGWFSGEIYGIPIIGWIAGGLLGLGYLGTRGE